MTEPKKEKNLNVTHRNNRNKRRAREMEQRIAKKLGGMRVPFSGAGALKGDVCNLMSPIGLYLLECKLSQAANKAGEKALRVELGWITKIRAEAKKMPYVQFGALVFHYHDTMDGDYVMLAIEDLMRLPMVIVHPTAPQVPFTEGRKGLLLYRHELDSLLAASYNDTANPNRMVYLTDGEQQYCIMRLNDFKEIVLPDESGNT